MAEAVLPGEVDEPVGVIQPDEVKVRGENIRFNARCARIRDRRGTRADDSDYIMTAIGERPDYVRAQIAAGSSHNDT